mgnify:CR=1 FL=1|tara:strand:+ start:10204 stop:18774 length:8571 start_codon:yes stop_codon:yes gene_type:complete
MDDRYSLQELASWTRGQFVTEGVWSLLEAQQMPDNLVVMELLKKQTPEKRDEIVRGLDTYGPDYKQAFGSIDWSGALRSSGQALHGMKAPSSISLSEHWENIQDGLYGELRPQEPNPKDNLTTTHSHGLFQLNSHFQGVDNQKLVWGKFVPTSEMSPEQNIEYASRLRKKEGWKRWTTHRKGLHEPFLGLDNNTIAKTYGLDIKYLNHIDKMFGEEADTAKAVMIAESSGKIDSMETIDVPAIGMQSENENNFRTESGNYITTELASLLGMDENFFKVVPDSTVYDSIENKIEEEEDILKKDGDSSPDNYLLNDKALENQFKSSLGIQVKKLETTKQDELSPDNITIVMNPTQKLAQMKKQPSMLKTVGAMIGKDWSYDGLKEANKLARAEMESVIQEDPELLAWMLHQQDMMEKGGSQNFKDILAGDGKTWAWGRDVLIQSAPSMVASVIATANYLTVKSPTVYALTGSFMFAQQAGGSFDEVFGELMEKEVKEGTLTESEALDIAKSAWVQTGIINTMLETMRIPSIAKAARASIPKKGIARTIFGKNKKFKDKISAAWQSRHADIGYNILKQATIESAEEIFQGINERYQNAVALGQVRPDEIVDWEWGGNILDPSQMVAEGFGGFLGGGVFGAGAGGVRIMANRAKRNAQENELNEEIDQQLDKVNGKNYNQGQLVGRNISESAKSEDHVDNMTWGSWLKKVAKDGGYNLDEYRNIKTDNEVVNAMQTIAFRTASEDKDVGAQVLNILMKNPDGMDILETLDEATKEDALILAREYIKQLFPSLKSNENLAADQDTINSQLDKMIGMFVNGELGFKKGRSLGSSLTGDGKKQGAKIEIKSKEGKAFVDALVEQRLSEESAIIDAIESPINAQEQYTSFEKELTNIFTSPDEKGDEAAAYSKKGEERYGDEEIYKHTKKGREQYEKVSSELGDDINKRQPYKPSKSKDPLEQKRGNIIGALESKENPTEFLSGLPATKLNQTLENFPSIKEALLKDKSIAKKKNGELSYSVANKKKIAKAIVSSIRHLTQEKDSTPTAPVQKEKPSKVDAGGVKRWSDMTPEEMMNMTGAVPTGDLTEVDVDEDTEGDVAENRKQTTGRTTKFDEVMASKAFPDNEVSDEIKEKTGKNKTKSSQIEREFKGLSPLAKSLLAMTSFEQMNIDGMGLETAIDQLLGQYNENFQDDSQRQVMVKRLIETIKQRYGSTDNFINRIRNFNQKYQKSSTDTQNHFTKAAWEILKAFQELLKIDPSKFSMNPLPDSDFIQASKHFQAAWTEFKKGYNNIGLSEKELFKRFYNGVVKQIRKLRFKVGNIKVLKDWFTKWAKSHEIGRVTNLTNRRFFTSGQDIGSFGKAFTKSMKMDVERAVGDFVDNVDFETQEGLSDDYPDTYDDLIGQHKRDSQVEKDAISLKNLIEESSGMRVTTEEWNDIRWDIWSRGKGTWKKDKGDYISPASNERMEREEFYEYLSSVFQVDISEDQSNKNYNIINSHYQNIINSIPRGDRGALVLNNVEKGQDGKNRRTAPDEKLLHTQTAVNPVNGINYSDFVLANFLEANPKFHNRVFLLSANEIYLTNIKRAHKKNPYQENNPTKFDLRKLYVKQDDFFNLDKHALDQLNTELALGFRRFSKMQYPAFVVASKGGKGKSIVIGVAEEEDVTIAMEQDNTDAWFDGQVEKGNITQNQADELKEDINLARGESVELAVATVGRYRFIQQTHGTKSMHEVTGYPLTAHYKRYNTEFSDGVDATGSAPFPFLHFNYKNAYAISDVTGKIIPLADENGDYIWDGNKPTSSSFFSEVAVHLGRMPDPNNLDNLPGWVKTFDRKMSENHEDYIQVKGLNTLAPEITVYEFSDASKTPQPGDNVIWKSRWTDDGKMEITSGNDAPLAFVMSNEEVKMTQGDYSIPNKIHYMEPNEIRMLQNANFFSKGSGTSPFQWFDQFQDMISVNPEIKPLFDKLIEAVRQDQLDYYKALQSMRENANIHAKYLQSLAKNQTVTKSDLIKTVEMLDSDSFALLLFSHYSNPTVGMLKNRFIINGAFSGRVNSRRPTKASRQQSANYSHVVPDWHGILKPHEFGATPLDPSWELVVDAYLYGQAKQIQDKWSKWGKTALGRRNQVDAINKFLENNPPDRNHKRWQQFFRSPIQHFTNPHMLQVKYFLYRDYGDIVFMHPSMMKFLEQDFDGDAVTGRKWNEEITKALVDFQWKKTGDNEYDYSDGYQLMTYQIPLDIFADPQQIFTPTTPNTTREVSNNFETGTQVGMVQNARTMRSALNHKEFAINFSGDFYSDVILTQRGIDEEVVMDYAPLKESITQGEIPQGDSIVVINGVKYLKTSSDREMAIIQQASFDESTKGLLSLWWSTIHGRQSSIGTIDNFVAFIRSRIFKVVDKEGNEVVSGHQEAQKVVKEIVNYFKTSEIRQGRDEDQNFVGAEKLIELSKSVSDKINNSLTNQVKDIKNIDLKKPKRKFFDYNEHQMNQAMQQRRRPIKPLVINDVKFGKIDEKTKKPPATYLEKTVAMLWEHMVKNQLEGLPNFLQLTKNQEQNARYMAMQSIVGKPGPEGAHKLAFLVKEYDLSDNDIVTGLAFARKMNKEFYMLQQVVNEKNQLIDEIELTVAKLDHDVIFNTYFTSQWVPLFNELSDGAKFISSLSFMSGTSTVQDMIPASLRLKFNEIRVENMKENNQLKRYKRVYSSELSMHESVSNQMIDYAESISMELTQEGDYGMITSKKGLASQDFKNVAQYENFVRIKKNLDSAYGQLVLLKETIDHLENKVEAGKQELSESSKRLTHRGTTRFDRQRNISSFLPSDLLDGRFMRLFGARFGDVYKDAPDSEPLVGSKIKLATFDDESYKLLEKLGNCKTK